MRSRILISALLLRSFFPGGAAAQQRLSVDVSAGGGLSWQSNRRSSASHLPDGGAHLLVAPHIALGKQLFLKTGAGYEQRKVHLRIRYVDADEHLNIYDIRNRLNSVTIPLQVGGHIRIRGKNRLQLSCGMSYHFLLSAHVDSRVRAYGKTGVQYHDQTVSYAGSIFLTPPGNRLNATSEAGFLLFTPACYIDAGYTFWRTAQVKVFYEYDLNDVETSYAHPGNSHIHYAGLALGWTF